MKKECELKYIGSVLVIGFVCIGCTSSGVNSIGNGTEYMYNGINFGYDRDASFKYGVQDGCKTATGAYTKNHELFNNDESYKFGWGEGRIKCHNKVPKI